MLPWPLGLHLRSASGEFGQEFGGRELIEAKAFMVLVPSLSGLECPSVQVTISPHSTAPFPSGNPSLFLPLTPFCLGMVRALLLRMWGSCTSCLVFSHSVYTFENSASVS